MHEEVPSQEDSDPEKTRKRSPFNMARNTATLHSDESNSSEGSQSPSPDPNKM